MDAMPPKDLDRLLTDTAFVRRLARALVRDPDQADDLAQDALVVALERPPREGTSPRGWLATVMRRLAIDRARETEARARREAAAARAESSGQAEETERHLELSRRVSEALRELEEPYRTALYLRYVEEISPDALAQRLNIPVATAKTRLRRGLELLRVRFDREWNGRETWSALLLPLTSHTSEVGLGSGVLVMSTLSKVVAVLCLCGAATWALWPSGDSAAPLVGPTTASAGTTELADPGRAESARVALADSNAPAPGIDVRPKVPEAEQLFARVLDERRFPVAGAHVALHVDGLETVDDDVATSDANGIARFEHTPKRSESVRVGLLAWDERGRGAASEGSLRGSKGGRDATVAEPSSLGDLVLAAGTALDVVVVEAGNAVPSAVVRVAVGVHRVPVATRMTDASGRVSIACVPAVQVVVEARSGTSVGRAESVLAAGGRERILVSLSPARTIEVTVVDRETKSPIADARVRLNESFLYTEDDVLSGVAGQTVGRSVEIPCTVPTTDERGRTIITGIGPIPKIEVIAEAAGYAGAQPLQGSPKLAPGQSRITVELNPLHSRSVRWAVATGEVSAPPSGTVFTVRSLNVPRFGYEPRPPLPVRVRMDGDAVVADEVHDRLFDVVATAPDGRVARLWVDDGKSEGLPVSFRSPRRVDVSVRDENGAPAAGVSITLCDSGNQLLAQPRTTDGTGKTSFDGLWGRKATVKNNSLSLGSIDLDAGGGLVECTLPTFRSVTLRFSIDGQPSLPSSYRVNAARTISEDPARGLARLLVTPSQAAGPARLHVSASGFLDTVVLLDPRADDEHPIDVPLHRPCCLTAHVTQPRDGRVRLRVEPWDAERERWSTGSSGQVTTELVAPNAANGDFQFRKLAPGRYRVRDLETGMTSDGVDLTGERATAEVALDLSNVVHVRGRVELPAGMPAWYTRVVVEDEAVVLHEPMWLKGSSIPDGHYVDSEGKFDIPVSIRGAVTLRAAHAYLSPDLSRGSAVVRGAVDDLVLKLVEGDEVRIPMAAFTGNWNREHVRVYAYRGEPRGEPAHWFRAPIVDDTARFSGLPRGTWTLWIDTEDTWAPTIVREQVVGDGITIVDAKPSPGSRLRVRVRHAEGTKAPRAFVNALRESEPMLQRSLNTNGEDIIVLPGLEQGRYAVHVSLDPGAVVPDQVIEFDGVHDVEIDVDAVEKAHR